MDNGARGTIKRGAFQIRQVPEKGREKTDVTIRRYCSTTPKCKSRLKPIITKREIVEMQNKNKIKQNSSHVLVYAERHSAKRRVVRSGELVTVKTPTWARMSESN